jgi:hypothetical protein
MWFTPGRCHAVLAGFEAILRLYPGSLIAMDFLGVRDGE